MTMFRVVKRKLDPARQRSTRLPLHYSIMSLNQTPLRLSPGVHVKLDELGLITIDTTDPHVLSRYAISSLLEAEYSPDPQGFVLVLAHDP